MSNSVSWENVHLSDLIFWSSRSNTLSIQAHTHIPGSCKNILTSSCSSFGEYCLFSASAQHRSCWIGLRIGSSSRSSWPNERRRSWDEHLLPCEGQVSSLSSSMASCWFLIGRCGFPEVTLARWFKESEKSKYLGVSTHCLHPPWQGL